MYLHLKMRRVIFPYHYLGALVTDKDISPTPKVPKSVYGRKVKRSKSASTSKAEVKVPLKDGNDTDSSDIIVPCSGTVSGIKKLF